MATQSRSVRLNKSTCEIEEHQDDIPSNEISVCGDKSKGTAHRREEEKEQASKEKNMARANCK